MQKMPNRHILLLGVALLFVFGCTMPPKTAKDVQEGDSEVVVLRSLGVGNVVEWEWLYDKAYCGGNYCRDHVELQFENEFYVGRGGYGRHDKVGWQPLPDLGAARTFSDIDARIVRSLGRPTRVCHSYYAPAPAYDVCFSHGRVAVTAPILPIY